MAAVASSSRVHASDLNGPVDGSGRDRDHNRDEFSDAAGRDERERDRRASPSYSQQQQHNNSSRQDNGSNNWRRLTPERALGNGSSGAAADDRRYHGNGNSNGDGYQSRGPRNNGYGGRAGNADFFASRRAQRDASTVSIWPPSPKTPRGDDDSEDERSRRKRKKDKKHKSKSSSSKKKKRYSSETASDSEDDDRRRSSKKHRSSRKHYSDEEEEEEREKDRRRHRNDDKKHSSHRHRRDSRSRSKSQDRIHNDQEDEWAEKDARSGSAGVPKTRLVAATAPADKSGLTSSKGKNKETDNRDTVARSDDSEDDEVGPLPLAELEARADHRDYGGALLRGEGEAMAAYVADGKRIPRRGEIGLESEQIVKFEEAGYVMSGSRHRRMNAVRMRKENQVISAEEKRQMLKTQKEEQDKKETMVVSSFKELLEKRLQGERLKAKGDY